MEALHRQEFESFMFALDDALKAFHDMSTNQLDQMTDRHTREIEDLRLYLEQSISMQAKPSPEILNMRKIQSHLSKQKNYTEAEKVQRVVRELEDKNQMKYIRTRDERIHTQLTHMQAKHLSEREALVKRIDAAGREQEKARRVAQQQLL